MKSILFTIIIAAACFPCLAQPPGTDAPPSTAADVSPDKSLSDMRKRFGMMQIKALDDYLAANPDADDFSDRLEDIFLCYRNEVGDREQARSTLERFYKHLVAKGDPDDCKHGLREIYYCYVGMEDKERAIVALQREYDFLAKGANSDLPALGENIYDTVYRLTESKKPEDVEKARRVIAKARRELAGHPDAKGVAELFTKLDGLINPPEVGTTPVIAFTALDGTKVNVADMKGKVVLLDFWATWCPPCVASMPGLKVIYDKFHDKGFEVIGISLENADGKGNVEDFVKQHQLPWPQSFEGKGWDHSLAITFGIRAIPATFLIGKDGKIIATDIHGEALEAKLAELLK